MTTRSGKLPALNFARMRKMLDGINAFGKNAKTGGHNRPGFGDADMAARRWLMQQMQNAGLAARMDGVANIFGRYEGKGGKDNKCIIAGSHLDTVPEGGAFDGALGVCAALECVMTMRDANIRPQCAIEVAATAEEEGRFGGMLGSQAIAGQVSKQWLNTARDADGITLKNAMQQCGLNAAAALSSKRDDIKAFVELHIEQGPVLAAARIPAGIVNSISGVCVLAVKLRGIANHSGTTPMTMRADAFAGLAQTGASVNDIIRQYGGEQSRITIGKVDILPNAPHTIPGIAKFSIVIRDTDEGIMKTLTSQMRRAILKAAKDNHLQSKVQKRSWLPPATLDKKLVALMEKEAARIKLPFMTMPSGAGHDAQTMQSITPSALIFAPSKGGISHAPEESTNWRDIKKTTTLMLATLIQLAG